MKQIETLPLWKKLIYGAGTFAWALASGLQQYSVLWFLENPGTNPVMMMQTAV